MDTESSKPPLSPKTSPPLSLANPFTVTTKWMLQTCDPSLFSSSRLYPSGPMPEQTQIVCDNPDQIDAMLRELASAKMPAVMIHKPTGQLYTANPTVLLEWRMQRFNKNQNTQGNENKEDTAFLGGKSSAFK